MEALCFVPSIKIPSNGVKSHNVHTTRSWRTSVYATVSKSKAEVHLIPAAEAKTTTEVLQAREQRLRLSPASYQYESGLLGAVPDHKVEEGNGAMSEMEYLTNIWSSNRVYDVAIESPLSLVPKLSERLGVNVWLKREDLQPVFYIKSERLALKNRIEEKPAYLKELEDQHVGLQNLINRNKQLYVSGNAPSGGVALPFILVQTRPHATVEVEISEDMQLVQFDFNSTPFELHVRHERPEERIKENYMA